MWIDSWGNESETEAEAKEKILNILRNSDDYCEILADNMNIPLKYFVFIANESWYEFEKEFSEEIKQAELEWADYYFNELYNDEEDDE
jgi:hypothetical protein